MLQGQPVSVRCHGCRNCARHDLSASKSGGDTLDVLKYSNAA